MSDLAALLFTCPRHPGNLRLLPAACATRWRNAQNLEPWNDGYQCRGCPVGATHAGCPPPPTPDPNRRRCSWCGGHGRLVLHGSSCVDCYNRTSEIARATGRRGKAPMHFPLLVFLVEVEDAPIAGSPGPGPGSRPHDRQAPDRRGKMCWIQSRLTRPPGAMFKIGWRCCGGNSGRRHRLGHFSNGGSRLFRRATQNPVRKSGSRLGQQVQDAKPRPKNRALVIGVSQRKIKRRFGRRPFCGFLIQEFRNETDGYLSACAARMAH